MTRPATAQLLGSQLPSHFERATANQLRRIIAAQAGASQTLLTLPDDGGKQAEVVLAPAVSRLLIDLAAWVGRRYA